MNLTKTAQQQKASTENYKDLLAYYDCMSGIAYSLIFRNSGSLNDPDHALLVQGYKEIAHLCASGTFLNGEQDVMRAVDSYMIERLPKIAPAFLQKRTKDQRLLLDINLLMREQCLQSIQLFINILNTLRVIKTPEALQIWDQAIAQSCFKAIDELKNSFPIFDKFPVRLAFDDLATKDQKALATYLALHHSVKLIPADIYTTARTQFYFLNLLSEAVQTLSTLATELPLLALPQLRNKNVNGLAEAEGVLAAQNEVLTDAVIEVLKTCEKGASTFQASITPTLKGMKASSTVLSTALDLMSQLPRKKRDERSTPSSVQDRLAEDYRWAYYRQRHIDAAKKKL